MGPILDSWRFSCRQSCHLHTESIVCLSFWFILLLFLFLALLHLLELLALCQIRVMTAKSFFLPNLSRKMFCLLLLSIMIVELFFISTEKCFPLFLLFWELLSWIGIEFCHFFPRLNGTIMWFFFFSLWIWWITLIFKY